MRTQLKFDLHFTDTLIYPQTDRGVNFLLHRFPGFEYPKTDPSVYVAALEVGLKVSFETIAVRDKLTSTQIKETV